MKKIPILTILVMVLTVMVLTACSWTSPKVPSAALPTQPAEQRTAPTTMLVPRETPTPAGPVALVPTKAFCQLGVTQLTDGVATHSLAWDPVQLRGYMDDALSHQIWENVAYCRTEFPVAVTLLFDSVAGNPILVDGHHQVQPGNGRIETGTVFEWVYPIPSRSNGHAYIVVQSAP